MATRKELIDQLVSAGDNTFGSKETVAELEARLADAKENGVRHVLSQEDIDANPDLVKVEEGETPIVAGDEVRLPWPAEAGSGAEADAKAQEKKDGEAAEKTEEQKAQEAADAKKAAEEAAAAQAEADAKPEEVELTGNIRYNGKKYGSGDKLTVSGKEARDLRAAKAAKPAAAK